MNQAFPNRAFSLRRLCGQAPRLSRRRPRRDNPAHPLSKIDGGVHADGALKTAAATAVRENEGASWRTRRTTVARQTFVALFSVGHA
jgi:hypothetical protein